MIFATQARMETLDEGAETPRFRKELAVRQNTGLAAAPRLFRIFNHQRNFHFAPHGSYTYYILI
jgi:hypothetical protein